MATSAQVPLNFKQIISSDKHLNINTKSGGAADPHHQYQRSTNPTSSSSHNQAAKVRKQSGPRMMNNIMQPLDSQVVAAALKQLGTVAAAGLMSSASKERVRKTP